ncbi:UDP-N-acetylmuramoyl-L-alanyl-D-glutamate--2,6-diaminopimelate ligase [Actinomycetospora sp. C-140]
MPAAPPRTFDDAAGPARGRVPDGGSEGAAQGADPGPLRPVHTVPVTITAVAERIHAALADDAAPEIVGDAAATVTGATLRAHEVRPGDLFAALPGARAHGADFAADALARGAAAVLTDAAGAERAALRDAGVPVLVHADPRGAIGHASALVYGDPSTRLAVLGVTGTSGKTTSVYLLEAALAAAGASTGLIGTVETRLGGQRLPSAFTTPEAPDLQALLARMADDGASHVAMEVSSHALSLGRVAGTRFAVGAFTNLSAEHLDFHADMEDYFAAKARLFDGRSAAEVVCIDTSWGRRLVREGTVTVGTPDADWRAEEIVALPDGTQRFTVHGPDELVLPVAVRLPGAFNVTNALLALACGAAAGYDPAALARGLAEVRVPGRMQRVEAGQPFLAVVDYAHKPAAVAALLETLRAGTDGRVLTVLGCGGDRDRAKRPVMGRLAAQLSDHLWVTDDNPRTEDPATIRAAVLDGAREVSGAVIDEVGDRREAIAAAVGAARAGDVVVVAGKGHETGQQIGAEKLPFSDVDELERALARVQGGRA